MKQQNKPFCTDMTAADIAAARKAARLTQEQAAVLVHVKRRTWQDWERGIAAIPGAAWELYLIKTGQDTNLGA